MPTLDELLARPGLPVAERLLVHVAVAVWPGDLEAIADSVDRYRSLDRSRADLEEALLQAVLFSGFPRVINAFQVLQERWPTDRPPAGGGLPDHAQQAAGDQLFRTIYGPNAEPVETMLRSYHQELHDFVIDTAYGRILSRPGLAPRVRELMAVGVLGLTDQVPQLVAHGRGAIRFGAEPDEVREAIVTGRRDPTYAARMLRRIEKVTHSNPD